MPVRYDGPDLADVAELTGLDEAEVVARHTAGSYRSGFCGFAPGFAYLTGLDESLHVPRRDDPRTKVPAGSVGLADEFTAIYPRDSPGGWQLIGSTDITVWDLDRDPPALLVPGTPVRFVDGVVARGARGRVHRRARDRAGPGPARATRTSGSAGRARPTGASSGWRTGWSATPSRLPASRWCWAGFAVRALRPAVVALTGAPCAVRVGGRASWMDGPLQLGTDDVLELGVPDVGSADLPRGARGSGRARVLGSRSTDTLAGLGPEPAVGGRHAAGRRRAGRGPRRRRGAAAGAAGRAGAARTGGAARRLVRRRRGAADAAARRGG